MTSTMLRVLAMATSLLVYSNVIDGATRSMRLVSSLHGGSGIAAASTKSYPDMTPRVAPRDYVGPPLLANLTGVCVNHLTANYDYRVCLFDNVTQHDTQNTWNPYHGILGTFEGWAIVNDTFHAILYHEGDACAGGIHRKTNVSLACGSKNRVIRASEPDRCRYLLEMETPYACDDILRVDHFLSTRDRQRVEAWREEVRNEELTPQGFERKTKSLYTQLGFLPQPPATTTSTTTTTTTTTTEKTTSTSKSASTSAAEYHLGSLSASPSPPSKSDSEVVAVEVEVEASAAVVSANQVYYYDLNDRTYQLQDAQTKLEKLRAILASEGIDIDELLENADMPNNYTSSISRDETAAAVQHEDSANATETYVDGVEAVEGEGEGEAGQEGVDLSDTNDAVRRHSPTSGQKSTSKTKEEVPSAASSDSPKQASFNEKKEKNDTSSSLTQSVSSPQAQSSSSNQDSKSENVKRAKGISLAPSEAKRKEVASISMIKKTGKIGNPPKQDEHAKDVE